MEIWIVVRDDAHRRRLAGRTLLDRILVTLRLHGVDHATLIVGPEASALEPEEPGGLALPCRAVAGTAPAPETDGPVLVVEADRVYDPRLLETMLDRAAGIRLQDGDRSVGLATLAANEVDRQRPGLVAIDEAVASIQAEGHLDLDAIPAGRPELRRSLRPWWVPVRDEADARRARRLLAEAAGKGTMEWLVLVLNRPVERRLSYYLAETRLTPNQITVLGNLIAYAAAALLAFGRVGAGLGLALVTQIVDGLDGRQARMQLRFSPAGKLEHTFDKAFEVAWMAALTWHLSAAGERMEIVAAGLAWILATFVANLAGSIYRGRRGVLPEQETSLDARIRLLGFRRNTSIAILFVGWVAGRLLPAFWLVVIGSVLTAGLVQARTWILLGRERGDPA